MRMRPGAQWGVLLKEGGWCSAAAAASALLALWTLGLWGDRWHRPLHLTQDANLNAMIVKGVIEHGWALENPSLGAPFSQRLYDFPFADNLSLALVAVLGLFTSDWVVVLNLFFVLTFPLVAVTSYCVARCFGADPLPAAALGMVYALAPYHFLRGEQHLFLSNYLAVPLAAGLLLAALRERGVVHREGAPLRGWLNLETAVTLVAAFVLSASVQYYPLFAVGLLVIAGGIRALANRNFRGAIQGLVLAGWTTTMFVLNLMPNLVFRILNGSNDDVVRRTLGETAIFSFQLTDLVLPMAQHRIPAFSDLSGRVAHVFGPAPEFGATAIGALATVGLLGLLGLAVVSLVSRQIGRRTDRHLALLVVVSLLLGMRGGLTALLAATVGTPLRAWNRLSIFIGFFCLLAVARAGTRRLQSVAGRRFLPGLVVLAAAAVIGVVDQTSPAFRAPDAAPAWDSDRSFVARIEAVLPPGGTVLQLPYVAFPESGPFRGMADYDHIRGYLHSNRLRWSYGAMRGRSEDIGQSIGSLPTAALVPAALVAGFDGLWLDRNGLAPRYSPREQELRDRLGAEPLVSDDGRFAFFSLLRERASFELTTSAASRSELRRRVLASPRFRFGDGFHEPETDFEHRWVWMPERAVLDLVNPLPESRRVVVAAEMETATGLPAVLSVRESTLPVPGRSETVTFTVELRPGRNLVPLHTTVPPGRSSDPRDLRLRLSDLRMSDEVVGQWTP